MDMKNALSLYISFHKGPNPASQSTAIRMDDHPTVYPTHLPEENWRTYTHLFYRGANSLCEAVQEF
jgi:hypothetical protein